MHNKLAIVIPFFKIHFIEKTLKSLAGQTDKRFNLYIGNDASLSDPRELIRYNLKDIDFKYFDYKENLGSKNLTLSWERLIDETQDEPYIYILGDDDFVDDNFVEEFYKIIEQNKNVHLIRYSGVLVDDNDRKTNRISVYPAQQNFDELTEEVFSGKIRSSLSENIFSREMYEKHGFKKYPLAWCSDTKLWLDIAYEHPVFSIQDSVVHTRNGATNISGNKKLNNIKNLSSLLFRIDSLNEYNLKDKAKKNILKELRYFTSKNKFVDKEIVCKYLKNKNIGIIIKLKYFFFFIYKLIKYRNLYNENKVRELTAYYFRK